jgi:hypothetical protein
MTREKAFNLQQSQSKNRKKTTLTDRNDAEKNDTSRKYKVPSAVL